MCPDNYTLSVSPCGILLALETQCPDTFGDVYLIVDKNAENIAFKQNTGEATAYQDVTKQMVEHQKNVHNTKER